jgi:16S rRNA (adenine1518-N6/adenine1519-N6)-dimethyltransferase
MKTRPRKRFGQNFLTDNSVVDRIVSAINPDSSDHIVEIGPGRGAITELLIRSNCQLDLIEIDRDLVALLQQKFGTELPIYSEDVLKFDFENLRSEQPIRVVGNLPYNISTPLMFKLFQYDGLFRDLTFMLQLEVVNRLTATPGGGSYGRLSIMSQYFCDAEKLFNVPKESFTPSPKVESAIVRLTPKKEHQVEVKNIKLLEQLLISAFSKRRKTIRNALGSYLSAEELEELGFDTKLRPENLYPEDFARCANYIDKRQKTDSPEPSSPSEE